MVLAVIVLIIAAVYCAGMYAFAGVHAIRTGEDVEEVTFHLGLCFVLAVGFLGLILK